MSPDLEDYLASIDKPNRRKDCERLLKIMTEESGYEPYLSRDMVCFGSYHYKYASGHEGDFMVTGFASRARNISIYILPGFADFADELAQLGKHKTARTCLTIKTLADIDEKVLRELIRKSVRTMQARYDCTA